MASFVGIDLGGTKIAAVLLDAGKVIHQKTIPTQAHEGPDAVLKRAAALVDSVCQESSTTRSAISGVGFGVPGVIDPDKGQTLLIPNLFGEWHGKPVVAILEKLLDCPVRLVNDARAFTLAEANLGAGRGAKTLACFTVGTGIGGGVALNGQLHLGLDSRAGEFGHTIIDPNGPLCGCGSHGCLETFASGPAIKAMGVKAILQGITSQIGALAEMDITRVTPELIMRAAESGDAMACEILQRAGTALGIGFANVITILSPDRVVVGGGVAQLGDWILNPARAVIRERCRTVPVDKIEVVRAAFGNEAGAIGAAVWAMQQSAA